MGTQSDPFRSPARTHSPEGSVSTSDSLWDWTSASSLAAAPEEVSQYRPGGRASAPGTGPARRSGTFLRIGCKCATSGNAPEQMDRVFHLNANPHTLQSSWVWGGRPRGRG